MADLFVHGLIPSGDLAAAIYLAADVLDIWECYAHEDRYHFSLGHGYSVAISADSGDRIRVDTCRLTRPVDTMWSTTPRPDRLAGLIRRMSRVPEAV